MNRRLAVAIPLVIVAVAGTAFGARRQAVQWRVAGGPVVLPASMQTAGTPSVWIFGRDGCRHCAAHLAGLARAASKWPEPKRSALLGRIHVAGLSDAVPAGCVVAEARWRDSLGIRIAPTTWLVDASGEIVQAWRGARGVARWEEALEFLALDSLP